MLAALGASASDRRLRLFACAYARTGSRLAEFGDAYDKECYEGLQPTKRSIDVPTMRDRLLAVRRLEPDSDERLSFDGEPPYGELGRRMVACGEAAADGACSVEEFASLLQASDRTRWLPYTTRPVGSDRFSRRRHEEYEAVAATIARTGRDGAERACDSATHDFIRLPRRAIRRAFRARGVRRPFREQTLRLQANLLREIFGDPFAPPPHVGRLEPDVVAVARSIYERRAYDELPILADALADAGDVSDEIVAHLAGPGPHVRGCWALDRVLESATT